MPIENILDNAACKVKTNNPKLHRWKNWKPNTPFAPVFDVPIWVEDLNTFFLDPLVQDIEDHGSESWYDNAEEFLRSWKRYNIFSWKTESTKFLQHSIARMYHEYCNALEFPKERPNDLWIKGWAVLLKPGDKISKHSHCYHENAFLSGNLMVSPNETTTDYDIPHLSHYYGPWKCENKPGRITLFPSWVLHKVDPTEEYRVSVGFDLFTYHSMEYISKNRDVNSNLQNEILLSIPLV